jgi:hypothetical protein
MSAVVRFIDHRAIATTVRVPQLGHGLTKVDLDTTIVDQRLSNEIIQKTRGTMIWHNKVSQRTLSILK